MLAAPINAEAARRTGTTWRQRLRDYLPGAGSIVDIMPRDHVFGATFHASDENALAADWQAVTNDSRQAMTSANAAAAPRIGRGGDESIRTRTLAVGRSATRFDPAGSV
jgi:hypothetical protein